MNRISGFHDGNWNMQTESNQDSKAIANNKNAPNKTPESKC